MVSISTSAVWTLTPAEERVRSGAVTGQPVDLKDGGSEDASVRACWLIELLAGRTDDVLHPKGLDVHGATVTGLVDWQARQVAFPVSFTGCTFDEEVVLDQAQVASLAFNQCTLPGVLLSRGPLRACCYRSGSAAAARSRAADPATTRAHPAAVLGLRRCTARATQGT